MRALLDINVLQALLDHDHIQHRQATRWLHEEIRHGWASCAITQNGFMRILSQPAYPSPVPPQKTAQLLAKATATDHHEYWRCEISILDEMLFDHSRIHGPRPGHRHLFAWVGHSPWWTFRHFRSHDFGDRRTNSESGEPRCAAMSPIRTCADA